MVLDPITDELQDLKKLEKVLISKRILFKEIALMYGKDEFFKKRLRHSHKARNICNILPSPAVSNELTEKRS